MENDLHSTYALLHDPLSFNYLKDGPPYLPGLVGGKVAAKVASEGKGWIRQAFAEAGQDVGIALDHGVADYGGAPMAELAVLLASLRAEAMIHQAHHWQTRGSSYYGDHLLFERVYGEVNSQVDGLAERAIGKGDTILVQPLLQMSHMATFTKLFYADAPVVPTPEEMPLLSLRAVLKSAVLLQLVYGSLEDKGQLSHGLDNLLQGIADKQESLVYLLKQRVKVREASVSATPRASVHRVVSRYIEAHAATVDTKPADALGGKAQKRFGENKKLIAQMETLKTKVENASTSAAKTFDRAYDALYKSGLAAVSDADKLVKVYVGVPEAETMLSLLSDAVRKWHINTPDHLKAGDGLAHEKLNQAMNTYGYAQQVDALVKGFGEALRNPRFKIDNSWRV